MRSKTDYLYYRELYSSKYYGKKYCIKIELSNGNIRYLYFDKDKHIKLTDNIKFASKFSRPPKNFDKYESYIKRMYKDSKVELLDYVVVKSKY